MTVDLATQISENAKRLRLWFDLDREADEIEGELAYFNRTDYTGDLDLNLRRINDKAVYYLELAEQGETTDTISDEQFDKGAM